MLFSRFSPFSFVHLEGGGRLVSALLALCLVLAGCAAPESSEGPLQGFFVEYESLAGSVLQASLTGPRAIMDRDGHPRAAYQLSLVAQEGVLRAENGSAGPPFSVIYHIDADHLVVRIDLACQSRLADGACNPQTMAIWTAQGLPPPLGFLWPRLQGRTSLPFMGTTWPWDVLFSHEGTGTIATQGDVPLGMLLDASGPLSFSGLDYPDGIRGTVSMQGQYTIDLTRRSVRDGGPLGVADTWPKALVDKKPWSAAPVLFDGQDANVLTRRFSYSQALDELTARNGEASRRIAEGGCVVGLKVTPVSGSTQGGDGFGVQDSLLGINYSRLAFDIAGASGGARSYVLTYRSANAIQPEAWAVEEPGDGNAETCAEKAQVQPSVSLTAFLDRVAALPIDGEFQINTYGALWSPRPAWRDQVGDATYYAAPYDSASLPANGITVTNQVYFLPGPGWWDQVYLPDETLRRLDSGI